MTSSIDESLALELDAIVELGETESTRNLIRNFFLADKYRKGSTKAPNEKFTHAAVIGAGVMGSGIAQWLSSRGISVILRDVSAEQLDRGLGNIEKTYGEAVKRGLMSEEKAKEGRSRVVASSNPGPMREVQIVIEAASEKLEVKRAIFHDLDTKIDDTDILATNTSALSISDLAAQTKHPGRVIGMHFFNPVSRMKLIEVVIGKQTSDETKERVLYFARQIGKIPVVVQDSPGFLVNRVLFPYLLEAAELFEQGVGGGRDRRRAGGVGDADGAAPPDRRDRGRHHGRHRRHPGKIVRRTGPHTGDLREDAGGKNARPQNRERLLQIRGQTAVA